MALSDMYVAIADEMARSDLSPEIILEVTHAINWYQHEKFWFSDATMVTINTIAGERRYTLPANFLNIQDVLGTIGNYTYLLKARTEQYIDQIDWGNNFWSSYPTDYSIWGGKIRLFPPPSANLPITVKGTVVLPLATTVGATKSYAYNTAFNTNDTIQDPNGNIETCITGGTTQAAPTKTYAANTAYVLGDTVADYRGNIQKCIAAGTSGAITPAWSGTYLAITIDNENQGPLQWQLIKLNWQTNYLVEIVDGTAVWQLTGTLSNSWTLDAEELIRDRALRNLYGRYVKSKDNYTLYTQFEQEALQNIRRKNYGKVTTGWLRPHF